MFGNKVLEMCMIFGVSSRKTINISNEIKDFFKNSNRNPHGWGLAVYNLDNWSIVKEAIAAYKSEYARSLNYVPAKLAIAHIRYATCGKKSYLNTHPFKRKNWVLGHNGSIKMNDLKNYETYGETDSEKILAYIENKLKRIENNSISEKIQCIENSINNISPFGKLNLIISDGEYMYIHSNYKNSLYKLEVGDTSYFCTKPLNDKYAWNELELSNLYVYKNGREIYKNTLDINEYKV